MEERRRGKALPGDGHGDVGGGERAAVHIAGAEGGAAKPYPATSVEPLLDRTHAAPSPSVLRLHAPPLNDDVICERGEEEQQITHVGSVENEVPNEVVDKSGQNLITPKVGMTFESEEKAYEMHNTYAGQVGFSVRKSKTKHRPYGSLYQKHLVCSSQGYRENESSQKDITRTGCDARVQFSISKERVWTVQKVVLDHNHYLASPNKSHKLRSQREVIEADRKLIGQIRRAGMKPAQVFDFMKEHYGGEDKIHFIFFANPYAMAAPYKPGGYTSLLMGVDQDSYANCC